MVGVTTGRGPVSTDVGCVTDVTGTRWAGAPSLHAVHDVATRYEIPDLTGPLREPSSWLAWLADVFRPVPDRFSHLHAVWQRAVELRHRDVMCIDAAASNRLELAALLHDVGRALDPFDEEPHGFVGARLLDSLGLHDVAPLVAHHSGARFEAAARRMSGRDRWTTEEPDVLAILTYLDRTTSGSGEPVSIAERRHDLSRRYGDDSFQLRNFDATLPEVRRAEQLLGLGTH